MSTPNNIQNQSAEEQNRELEKTRQELEATLRAIDNSAIVSITDLNGVITKVNDQFCQISGYSASELLGKTHRLINSGYHPAEFWAEMYNTVKAGNTWRAEVKNRAKDGSIYWVDTVINPICDLQDNITSLFSIRYLITEKKQQEEELILREYQLNEATGIANVGRWELDLIDDHLHWSDGIYSMFEIDRERFSASYEGFLGAIHPEDRDAVNQAYSNSLETGQPYDIQHRLLMPDGRVKWVIEKCRTEYNDSGEPLRSIGIVQDITELKVVEEELRKARQEADKSNNAKSEFLSSMSHELRTPMNAILGFAQLLDMNMEGSLSQKDEDYVKEIIKAGDHLLELINDVLELSRIESGKLDISIEDVELDTVVEEVLRISEPLALKKNIDLDFEGSSSQFSVIVQADRIRLKQVLLNLISNAIKYNHPGGTVRIYSRIQDSTPRSTENEPEPVVALSVEDSGKGIPADKITELFQPFSRLGADESTEEGTGIGLVITRRLIEMMGGSIYLKSMPGEGSTFTVEVPFASYAISDRKIDPPKNKPVARIGKNEYTILYVEDNPANLRLVTRFFESFGNIHLLSAHTGTLGMELAESRNIDLFLLDINLPGISGYRILERIRLSQRNAKKPVIALSASAMRTDVQKGKEAGFDEYLTKPINLHELQSILTQYLVE